MRMSDESPSLHLAWRSRRDTRVAIHPSISDSSQPTAFVVSLRLEGNCPRHSRRQSVVLDSPVRAQTSRHRRSRAGELPACAGCPMRPCHDGCSALSSLEVTLRDGESRPQLCVHHREQFARVRKTQATD